MSPADALTRGRRPRSRQCKRTCEHNADGRQVQREHAITAHQSSYVQALEVSARFVPCIPELCCLVHRSLGGGATDLDHRSSFIAQQGIGSEFWSHVSRLVTCSWVRLHSSSLGGSRPGPAAVLAESWSCTHACDFREESFASEVCVALQRTKLKVEGVQALVATVGTELTSCLLCRGFGSFTNFLSWYGSCDARAVAYHGCLVGQLFASPYRGRFLFRAAFFLCSLRAAYGCFYAFFFPQCPLMAPGAAEQHRQRSHGGLGVQHWRSFSR